jgi:hypothetical protein
MYIVNIEMEGKHQTHRFLSLQETVCWGCGTISN